MLYGNFDRFNFPVGFGEYLKIAVIPLNIGPPLSFAYANPGTNLKLENSRFTIEAWVNFASVSSGQVLWDYQAQGDWATGRGFGLGLTSSGLPTVRIGIGTGANQVASGGTSLESNVWYHLAGTYDNGVAGLYVNGTEVDSKSVGSIVFTDASGGPVPKTIYVGVSHNANSSGPTYENHLHYPLSQGSLVDRIRVHDRVLSGSELDYFFGTSTQSLQGA